MTEQPGYTYWECRDCGFDAVTSDKMREGKMSDPICPLCAEDNGRDVVMHGRIANTDDTSVEGVDARRGEGK